MALPSQRFPFDRSHVSHLWAIYAVLSWGAPVLIFWLVCVRGSWDILGALVIGPWIFILSGNQGSLVLRSAQRRTRTWLHFVIPSLGLASWASWLIFSLTSQSEAGGSTLPKSSILQEVDLLIIPDEALSGIRIWTIIIGLATIVAAFSLARLLAARTPRKLTSQSQ